jgi:hypothetical protein
MRVTATGTGLLFVALIAAAVSPVKPGSAAGSYCPNPDHATPGKVPPDLMGAVATTFQIDCDKAETRRSLPGATAWCRENPGSKIIPMSATGHDTIYAWSCKGRHAIAGKATVTVDPQGYIADNWREIR